MALSNNDFLHEWARGLPSRLEARQIKEEEVTNESVVGLLRGDDGEPLEKIPMMNTEAIRAHRNEWFQGVDWGGYVNRGIDVRANRAQHMYYMNMDDPTGFTTERVEFQVNPNLINEIMGEVSSYQQRLGREPLYIMLSRRDYASLEANDQLMREALEEVRFMGIKVICNPVQDHNHILVIGSPRDEMMGRSLYRENQR